MPWKRYIITSCLVFAAGLTPAVPQENAEAVKVLVERLDLEKYKTTIKALTQFGDRRQGTDRNRSAVDWIEAQLASYGCSNTERLKYDYQPAPPLLRPPLRQRLLQRPPAAGGRAEFVSRPA